MSRDNFVRNCRQQFPQYVSPVTSIDDAVKILKSKRIIAESISENMDYKDPYVRGYIENENGSSLNDCPFRPGSTEASLWKDGWMDAEAEKQAAHDDEIYRRETNGAYDDEDQDDWSKMDDDDKYPAGFPGMTETLNEAEDLTLSQIVDRLNPYTLKIGIATELKDPDNITNDSYEKALEIAARKLYKDPNAYKEYQFANAKEVDAQDKNMQMTAVKEKNTVDDKNQMEKVKGQETLKAMSAPKTENKKGKPEGVKEMGVTPKKTPGITSVMDMPGKEKVLEQLIKSLKKTLAEDTHYKYNIGTTVDTPEGPGKVVGVLGGTISVELGNGTIADYQINILDAQEKKNRDAAFSKLPDLGTAGQNWLSSHISEDNTDAQKDEFKSLVDKYDWYHEMSDDDRKHQAALEVNKKLKALAKSIGEEEAVRIYNEKAPKDRKIKSIQDLSEGKKDKYSKLKEYLRKALKKEAIYQKKDQTGQTQTIVASSPKSDATLRAQKFTKIAGTDDAKSTQ